MRTTKPRSAATIPQPAVLRVRITAGAARAFAQRALKIVAAGRPPCPLCGQPLDAQGHVCSAHNGHPGVMSIARTLEP